VGQQSLDQHRQQLGDTPLCYMGRISDATDDNGCESECVDAQKRRGERRLVRIRAGLTTTAIWSESATTFGEATPPLECLSGSARAMMTALATASMDAEQTVVSRLEEWPSHLNPMEHRLNQQLATSMSCECAGVYLEC